MLINKIAQNDAFDTDIKNERVMSLFKQKVSNGNLYWKSSAAYKNNDGDIIYNYLGYVLTPTQQSPLPNQIYSFNLSVAFSSIDRYGEVYIDLYLNKTRSPSGEGEENIGSWVFRDTRTIESLLKPFLKAEFGIDMLRLPKEEEEYKRKQQALSGMGDIRKNIAGKNVIEGVRLTRHKSRDYGDAKSLEVYVYPVEDPFQGEKIFVTAYKITNLEKQTNEGEKVKFSGDLEQAIDQMNELIARAKSNKYVDETSTLDPYIPANANLDNYDFVLRRFKEEEGGNVEEVERPLRPQMNTNIFGGGNKKMKIAQEYEGYYSGDVPDYAVQNLGTGAVDASQVSSMFSKADDAIRLVNEFDSSLLSSVSFIFNFSKGGAYGVYLSELDRAIKTKALQNKLEASGYRVENEDGLLRAYPTKEEKTPEQVQQDIDTLYADLESKGGTAFGINMNSVLNAAKQDAMATQSEDPNIWEWMAMLHLGGTIVHEAIHAKGNHDEGPSENAEAAFTAWALPRINQQYMQSLETQGKGEMFSPIIVGNGTRSAKNITWYKKAQYSNYTPNSFTGGKPRGSDLSGRSGEYTPQEGMADWGLLVQQDQNIPLEKKLGRGFMSPLPDDLDQANDSYEEQLRKYTREDERHAPDATMEDLLSRDYDDENTSYMSIEELLEERRPKPLMIPLDRTASNNMIKTATLFGWMNNLEISDGSTIPGLSDRVMAWEDGEGDFAWTEKEIRSQPRYNPSYDIKGFYYRWIEPRFAPQLFDDMARDYSGTHPAKRFASKSKEDKELIKVFNILAIAKRMVASGNIQATRFIMSEDMLPMVEATLASKPNINVMIKYIGEDKNSKDDIYSVWIYSTEVDKAKVKVAEDIFTKGRDLNEELFEELFNVKSKKEQTIKNIITNVKKICREYGVEDIYLVGGYPRAIAAGEPIHTVEDLDFSGAWPNQSIKIGGLLAERLGVKNSQLYHRTMTLSFVYKGIKVDFKGNFSPVEIRKQMRDQDIPTTPLNMDIYNRDFTINMLVYDINKDEVFDICGESIKDLNSKIIRTYFDPDYICKQNPLIITRALKFKKRGYEIDPDLEKAMIMNSPLLFDGRYSDERIIMAREIIEAGDKELASELFKEYGLYKIKEY